MLVSNSVGSNAASMRPRVGSIARARLTRLRPAGLGRARAVICALVLTGSSPGFGADLYHEGDVDIRLDTTVRLSEMARLFPYSDSVVANVNADDGDRNFAAGLVSNRLDLLSEFDVSDGDFGIHASGAAWYDTVYHQRNNNNSPSTFNPVSVPNNEFTRATERLQGEDAELLDAFLYGNFDAFGIPVSMRVGRHTLLWGESLFFADNGISAGQAPIDAIKEVSEPGAPAKELFLPVGQVSEIVQLLPNLDFSFYYQFEWERTRLPASGSYLSDADFLDAGGERLIVEQGEYLYRGPDRAASGSGQFGAALHMTQGEVDLGLYALRYNSKEPEILLTPGIVLTSANKVIVTDPSIVNLAIGRVGDYELVFPNGIDAYGASVSFYAGDTTLAGEVSGRRNMPLVSGFGGIAGGFSGDYGGAFAALPADRAWYRRFVPVPTERDFPVGDTLQAQFSSVTTIAPSRLWDGADLSAEIAMNELLDVTRDPYDLNPSRTKFAAALRTEFQPAYFQVLPNLDVSVPLELGLGLIGRSSIDGSQNAGAGDIDIGLSFSYRAVWKAGLTFTHFVGGASKQPLADRDFVSFSVQRTF